MRIIHKYISIFIFIIFVVFAYFCVLKLTEVAIQILATFFSIVFGLYMTSVAILYNSSYTKILNKQVDKIEQKSSMYILKTYLLLSGYWSVFSIVCIIMFSIIAERGGSGDLYISAGSITLPFVSADLDLSQLISAGLLGVSALNIFYMLLLMRTIIDGLMAEANT